MEKIYALLFIITITTATTLIGAGKLPDDLAREFAQKVDKCLLIQKYKLEDKCYSIEDYRECI